MLRQEIVGSIMTLSEVIEATLYEDIKGDALLSLTWKHLKRVYIK